MRFFLGLGLALLGMGTALAQDGVTLTYQGQLADAAGAPVSASHSMTFRLYGQRAGGEALWTEAHDGVEVVDGVFTVDLGENVPLELALSEAPALFMGVQVGENDEMAPRIKVGGALKAQWAQVADHARDVRGEHIHPAAVNIGNTPVIDAEGRWVGDPAGLAGPRGPDGPQGEPGVAGRQGEPGPGGPRGEPGSVGPHGDPGQRGPEGPAGPALDFEADGDIDGVADWLELALGFDPTDGASVPLDEDGDGIPDALVGPSGPPGIPGDLGGAGPQGPSPAHQWVGTGLRFQNPDGTFGDVVDLAGPRGVPGDPGNPGNPGADGVGITDADIDGEGNLLLTLSTGEVVNAGSAQGPEGPPIDLRLDTDDDGFPDWVEVALGTNPENGEEAPEDGDGDGVADGLQPAPGNGAGPGNNGDGNGGGGGLLSIIAGNATSCGIRADGSDFPVCVGNVPTLPDAGPVRAIELVNSDGTTCVIRADGSLLCAGSDDFDILDVPEGNYRALASARFTMCALREDDSIQCWGRNDAGCQDCLTEPEGEFQAIAGGYSQFCALTRAGEVRCWGSDDHGAIDAPEGVFAQISAAGYAFCGRRADGTVSCWGNNANGLTTAPAVEFAQLSSSNSYGAAHFCGVRRDGTLLCWGRNVFGQAWPVPPGSYSDISVGNLHSCAMRGDGVAVCWGNAASGRLGCNEGIRLGMSFYCEL